MLNLNVLEILRLGLSGLCFMFSVLAFWLIQREQRREANPRKGILKSIYIFMAVNLVSAVLTGGLGYLTQRTGAVAEALSAKTYLVENTSWMVDLTRWTPADGGPVVVRRSDVVKKVSDTHDDFLLPSYTTGKGIGWKNIGAGMLPTFIELPPAPDQPGRHSYEYRLPMGQKPKDDVEQFSSQFTFQGGFKGENSRWWKGYVAYPSKSVTIAFRFPADRPCLGIKVYLQEGAKSQEPVTENSPLMSEGGQVVTWTGVEISKETRIGFEWEWNDQELAKN